VRLLPFVTLVASTFAFAAGSGNAAPGVVRAQATLSSGPYLFGQQITADVEAFVDKKLVDPSAVSVRAQFAPYSLVRAPVRTTTADGTVVHIRVRYVLECLSLACTTGSKLERRIAFEPARLRYRNLGGHQRSVALPWAPIREISRVGNDQPRPATASEARIELPLNPLQQLPASIVAPPTSYRLSPVFLAALLFAATLALLVASWVVGRPLLALLGRTETAAAEALSPLEQAVVAVEVAADRQAGTSEHREALALLARELRRAHLPDLVRAARKLAWSEQAPTAAASRELVAVIRQNERSIA
jgi:hypothetical protein